MSPLMKFARKLFSHLLATLTSIMAIALVVPMETIWFLDFYKKLTQSLLGWQFQPEQEPRWLIIFGCLFLLADIAILLILWDLVVVPVIKRKNRAKRKKKPPSA